ncbi:MAG: TlpA family protein disulfide reductase [Deltaproteobacteria bacterium]|nr:TlpA family protein disulfide reductase [Deltaproteobacteria bacterium]
MNSFTLKYLIVFVVSIFLPASAYASQNLFSAAGIEEIKEKPPAAEFTLKSLDEKMVSIKDFRGKVILLNFWATWCPPCKFEMPEMESLYKKYKDKGLVMLAVDIQESPNTVKKFIQKNGYTFTVLLDSDGDVSRLYNAVYIPITYIIDKNGKLIGKAAGAREWSGAPINSLIEELLK